MFDDRDHIDFANTEIPKLFRSLFFPTLLGMMFNAAFVLTDGIFVGHGVGAEGLACINLIAPIMMVVTGCGMMFGIGSSVVAAIHLAQQNEKAARINVTQAFLACCILALVMGAVFYSSPLRIQRLLGVTESLIPLASEYYLWFIPTCLFLMFQLVGEFVIRLDGAPRYAMYANIIPAVVNIVLDYIFIIPCHLGLKGAALATDIGTFIGALMVVYYMAFKATHLRLYRIKHTWTSLRLSWRNIRHMSRMGFSALLGEAAISIMMLTGNHSFGHYLGNDGIAAFSIICYLFPIVYMIFSAVVQSAQPIISYNHGGGQSQRVGHTLRHSLAVNLAIGAVATLLFTLFPRMVIAIFITPESSTFPLAAKGLPVYTIGMLFIAFNLSVIGYMQSIEKAALASWLMALRGILLPVAAFTLLPLWMGDWGLWLSIPVAEIIAAAVMVIPLWRRVRQQAPVSTTTASSDAATAASDGDPS